MRIFALLLLLVVLSGCTSSPPEDVPVTTAPQPQGPVIEVGDLVWIDFTGKVQETGGVFDTTYEDIGTDDGIPKTERYPLSIAQSKEVHYGPLGVIVGTGQIMIALEKALIDMGVGDEKSIVIPTQDAYGIRNNEYILEIPLVAGETPIDIEISEEEYKQLEGKDPAVGDTIQTSPYWSAVINDIQNGTVFIENMPEDGKVVQTPNGLASIQIDGSNIQFVMKVEEGSYIETQIGLAHVVSIGEETFIADFNHPLADKTLSFDIVVKDITKNADFADWKLDFLGYEEGLQKARDEGKKVVMDLYWSECSHCQRLEAETFPDPRLTELRDDFVWIKEEVVTDRPDLKEKYDVNSFPTIVILDSEAGEIGRLGGYMNGMVLRWELEPYLDGE